jgi:hypothetical protein
MRLGRHVANRQHGNSCLSCGCFAALDDIMLSFTRV